MTSSTDHHDPEIWEAAPRSFILLADKLIAYYIKTMQEITTSAADEWRETNPWSSV